MEEVLRALCSWEAVPQTMLEELRSLRSPRHNLSHSPHTLFGVVVVDNPVELDMYW